MRRRIISVSAIALLIACAFGRPAATVVGAPAHGSCADLASVTLPDTNITSAAEVCGPSFTPPGSSAINGLPEFCRVEGVTKPAVKFEVRLGTRRPTRAMDDGRLVIPSYSSILDIAPFM